MILWFAGMSLLAVWVVFRDPALDHRLVIAGALLPDAADGALAVVGVSGPWPAHSLLASAGLLVGVMVGTKGHRLLRRRLLTLPIGTFLHLVLDGAWADAEVFWWPFLGVDVGSQSLPAAERGAANVVLEIVGLLALAWAWRRFRLGERPRRQVFLRTGRIGRDLAG